MGENIGIIGEPRWRLTAITGQPIDPRGTVYRIALGCGCVWVQYSSPEAPYSREAVERRCLRHQSEAMTTRA